MATETVNTPDTSDVSHEAASGCDDMDTIIANIQWNELRQLRKELARKQNELFHERARYSNLDTKLGQRDVEIHGLQRDVQIAGDATTEMKETLHHLQEELNESYKKCDGLERDLKSQRSEATRLRKDRQAEHKKQLQKAEQEVESLQGDLKVARDKVESVVKQLLAHETEKSTICGRPDETSSNISSLEITNERLTIDNKRLRSEIPEVKGRIKRIERDMEQKQSTLEMCQAELRDTKDKLLVKENELARKLRLEHIKCLTFLATCFIVIVGNFFMLQAGC